MTGEWKFDYHDTDNDFLKWLMLALVPAQDKEAFDALSERTNQFRNIELGITINGTPVDTEDFLGFLERNLRHRAEEAADRRLERLGIRLLIKKLQEAERDILDTVKDRLEDEGIHLRRFNDEDDW